ncbi:MAG: hypothetical protein ACRCUP_01360 [Mycoplasmatales bacterium]
MKYLKIKQLSSLFSSTLLKLYVFSNGYEIKPVIDLEETDEQTSDWNSPIGKNSVYVRSALYLP